MTTGQASITDISTRNAAKIAGVSYLLIGVFALISFAIRDSFISQGNPAQTVNNIAEAQALWQSTIIIDVLVQVTELFLIVALYIFLRPVNRGLSLLTALFRLVMTTILALSTLNLITISMLATNPSILPEFSRDQTNDVVMLLLETYDYSWYIGLIFFAFHLVLLGYLFLRADYVPRILGIIMVIGGLCYFTDSLANILVPSSTAIVSITGILPIIGGLGEFAVAFWMLFRGGTSNAQVAGRN